MPKEVNKFILEGEEIEFTDSKARQDIDTLDAKVDSNFDLLDGKIDTEAGILDSKIDTQVGILDGKIEDVDDKCDNNYDDLNEKIGTQGVPAGGSTGQMLTKSSNGDYATGWENAPKGIPAGGSIGQILGKSSSSDYDVDWVNAPSPAVSEIDDNVVALDKTWSSSKINNVLTNETGENIAATLGDVTTNLNLHKWGSHCALRLEINNFTASEFDNVILATLPSTYRPKYSKYFTALFRSAGVWSAAQLVPATIVVYSTGEILIRGNDNALSQTHYLDFYLQWEV